MEADWGLEAVVRGCSTTSGVFMDIQEDEDDIFNPFPHDDIFETSTALDKLEELYKPFFPENLHPLVSSPTILSSSVSVPKQFVAPEKKPKDLKDSALRYKKRKNQQKREVKEVKEDELSSDKWAWRKYGQKPIKGSPYPRSYYRCSSSKGCSARKQVERSCSNPEIFIITYTAEHSHAYPARRNCLAGSTRNKFPIASKNKAKSSSDSTSTKDEFVEAVSVKKEEQVLLGDVESNEIDKSELMLSHELVPSSESLVRGLEDEQNSEPNLGMDYDFLDQQYYSSDGFLDAWFFGQPTTFTALDDHSPKCLGQDEKWDYQTLDRFLNEADLQ
ncbi:hypothetical protein FNV43_RR09335 [Rhamnella rubrinervis]|uniref:WRKY domain-containing protein n=1 Tax=Rhamnella rubrinervis TaxID=2594499 RepID=A0A8K0H9S8_9ROSA|nr:hypothetical protein FNV43_RR09335 [Rhamnella rubrinervis]